MLRRSWLQGLAASLAGCLGGGRLLTRETVPTAIPTATPAAATGELVLTAGENLVVSPSLSGNYLIRPVTLKPIPVKPMLIKWRPENRETRWKRLVAEANSNQPRAVFVLRGNGDVYQDGDKPKQGDKVVAMYASGSQLVQAKLYQVMRVYADGTLRLFGTRSNTKNRKFVRRYHPRRFALLTRADGSIPEPRHVYFDTETTG